MYTINSERKENCVMAANTTCGWRNVSQTISLTFTPLVQWHLMHSRLTHINARTASVLSFSHWFCGMAPSVAHLCNNFTNSISRWRCWGEVGRWLCRQVNHNATSSVQSLSHMTLVIWHAHRDIGSFEKTHVRHHNAVVWHRKQNYFISCWTF